MKKIIHVNVVVLSFSLSVLLSGCFGRPGPETAEVHGRVTMNGQPVTSGRVLFFPTGTVGEGAGKPAQGLLDSEGEFELRTYEDGDGAVVGEHRVTVLSNPDPMSGGDAKSLGTPNPDRATVKAGETNEFDIELRPPRRTPRGRGGDEEEEDPISLGTPPVR
jgi:hypothetical protein